MNLLRQFLGPRREPMGETRHFLDDPLPPIGRKGDTETISRLLQENRLVTIHGIVGSGKTRLAKFVYDTANGFDRKIWICVSDGFKSGKVIKKILGSEGVTALENGALRARLRVKLRERRFLVVLDDLWTEDEEQWRALARLLMEILNQGKIIVTTRNQSVVNMIDTVSRRMATFSVSSYHLNVLSNEDLLLLLERYAFTEEILAHQEIPEVLRTIGQQIVARCDGLPLAVKILAVTLSENRETAHWESIRDRNQDEFEQFLRLCRDLPVYCKDRFFCFSPLLQHKDIKYEDLFDLWMTDGLFESLDQEKSVTVVEKELKSIIKSIIEQQQWNILRDLICHPSIIRRLTENQWPVINVSYDKVGDHVVHLSISCPNFGEDRNPGLQTLSLWVYESGSVSKLFSERVSKFKLLRMLVLKKTLLELPTCIDYMSRLKCLNLSWNSRMTKLPSFIFKMRNLEILKLEGCSNLKKLPQDIKKLSGLKVLSITAEKTDSPSGIENLTSLRSLLIRDCKTPLPIGMYLIHLTALQSLTIYGCPNLDFTQKGASTTKSLLELKLEKLPNLKALPLLTKDLRLLHINNCEKLEKLPDWLPDMSLESIVIGSCRQLRSLPEGMPQLKSLSSLEIVCCPALKSYLEEIMEDEDQNNYFEGKLYIRG